MKLDLLKKPSLTTRIGVGKLAGFCVGLSAFVFMPLFLPDVSQMTLWAFLLWYTTMGAVIGVYGVFDFHPVLEIPFPWWIRAPLLGAWFNFVLLLFIHDQLTAYLASLPLSFGAFFSLPLWFIIEGGFVGLLIGWLCTWTGGEGTETVNFHSASNNT